MRIVLFDDNPSALLPFTYIRPSWDVNVGGITLKEWIALLYPHADIIVEMGPYLKESVEVPHLALNGRLLPSPALANAIHQALTGSVTARFLAGHDLAFASVGGTGRETNIALPDEVTLLRAPWEVVKHLMSTLAAAADVKEKDLQEIRPGVFAKEGTALPPTVVTRTEHGPIVIGEQTQFGSFIVLEGPLVIGNQCVVRDQAVIARAAIGNVCKVGGEIEDSIIDAYSNKQHHGYVGHSMVGRWVNLGAGTTTSDLKLTYGTVRVDRGAGKEDTGMQFCGAFLGDGAKTAVNTSLMSGAVLGINVFAFGIVKGFIPSFSTVTGQGLVEMPLEVALKMRERMMVRRGMSLVVSERDAFRAAYARTAAEREAHHVKQNAPLAI